MRKGLTKNIDAIIEKVAAMESIKPYILAGGTALAMQIGHLKSEDLDFMMWRKSKTEKPEVDWTSIEKELKEQVKEIIREKYLPLLEEKLKSSSDVAITSSKFVSKISS